MNHVFSTVWNTVRKCLVAVNESAGSKQARGGSARHGMKIGAAAAVGIVLVPSMLSTAVAAASTPTSWGAEDGKNALVFGSQEDWFSIENGQSVVSIQNTFHYGYDWVQKNQDESVEDWKTRVNGLVTRREENSLVQVGSLTPGILSSGIYVLGRQKVQIYDGGKDISVDTPIFVNSFVLSDDTVKLTIGNGEAEGISKVTLKSLTVGENVTREFVLNATEEQKLSMQHTATSLQGQLEIANADVAVEDLYIAGQTKSHIARGSQLTAGNVLTALVTGGYLWNEGSLTVTGSIGTIKELRYQGQIDNAGTLLVKGDSELYTSLHTAKDAESTFEKSLVLGGGRANGMIVATQTLNADGKIDYINENTAEFTPNVILEGWGGNASRLGHNGSVNEGTLTVGGDLTVVGAWILGTSQVERGVLENTSTGTITAKSVTINGYFNNNGGMVNAANGIALNNYGTLINKNGGAIVAGGTSTINGLFRNEGGNVSFENVNFGEVKADYADGVAFGGSALHAGKVTVTGTATIDGFWENNGELNGNGTGKIVVNSDKHLTNASGSEEAWAGKVTGFDEVTVKGRGELWQYLGAGTFETKKLTNEAYGKVYVSVSTAENRPGVLDVTEQLSNSGTIYFDGTLNAGAIQNSGTIQSFQNAADGSAQRGYAINASTSFENTGSVRVETADITNLKTSRYFEAGSLTLKGTGSEVTGGTFKADAATIAQGAVLSVGTGVAVNLGNAEILGELKFNNGSATVETLTGSASGKVTLSAGSTLTVNEVGAMNGMNVVLDGGTLALGENQKLANTTLTLASGDSSIGSGLFADGIGEGNKLVLDGGDFSFGSSALDGENAIEIKNGTLTANTINLTGENKITLDGGTFETAFSQMFEGSETGTVTGKDENGNDVVVQVPSAGITSVGTVKEAVKNGLEVVSGTFRFNGAETGWTAGTVASAQSVLTSTFTPTGSINVAFAGNGAGAGGVKYDTAFFNGIAKQEGVGRIIFEDIALEAGKPNLIVGEGTADDSTAVVQDGFGYGYIKDASYVVVTDGKTLQLAGFEGENAWSQHLLSASSGSDDAVQLNSGAELILGNGGKRGGLISNLAMNDAKLSVLDNGEFHAAKVEADGTNVLGSSSSGTLQIGTLTTYSSTEKTTFNGKVFVGEAEDADGAGNVSGEVLNNGSLTYGGESITFLGGFSNAGSFGVSNDTAAQVTVQGGENTGLIEVLHDGDGRFTAAEKTFTNKGSLSADHVLVRSELFNEKTVTAAYAGIDAGAVLTNSGTMTLTANESGSNQALLINGGKLSNSGTVELKKSGLTLEAEGSEIANSGTITALSADIRNGTLAMTGSGKLHVGAFTVGNNVSTYALNPRAGETVTGKYIADGDTVLNAESFTVADQGSASFSGNAKLQRAKTTRVAEGGTLSADGSAALSVGEMGVSGSVELKGNAGIEGTKLTVASTGAMALAGTSSIGFDSIRIEKEGSLTAEDGTSVTTQTLQTFNESFKLNGALTITGDKGIQFMKTVDGKEVEDASSKVLVVEAGKEYAQASGDFSTTLRRFDVTKGSTVAFGADAAGLAQKMAEKSETAKAWINKAAEANSGIFSVGTNIRLAAGSGLSLGKASADADAAKPYVNAAADSVTVISGKVFENDGAAFEAVGTQGTAAIDKDAKLVLTSLSKEGEITFFRNFDLSGNVDGSAWIGGWTGEGAIYVADGSELWNIETYWDAEAGTLKGKAELADVRTKYDLVIADIANAALRSDAGNGGDVKFLQAAIRNTTLSFDETNRLVNSVAQIGASVGALASFVSDVSSFAETVEERAGYRSASEEGLWLKAEGGRKTQDKLDLAGGMKAGYETDAYGFTFGGDRRVVPEVRLGAAFSYMKGKADSKGDVLTAENDYDTFGVQGYGSWDVSDSVRVIGDVGYFHTSNDIEQTIAHADVRSADAEVKSNALTFGARVEGIFDLDAVTVIPHVGVRGIYAVNDDYTTRIDGEDAFRNEADNTFTAQLPVGVALEKTFATASGWEVAPYADVTLIPQFGDTDSTTTVKGVGTGVSNNVSSDFAGTFAGQLSLGIFAGKDAFTFGARYGLTAGNAGREDHVFSLSARYAF